MKNNPMNRNKRTCTLLMTLLVLPACYEDTTVVIHEPHRYKGKPDTHSKDSETRLTALQQRFERGQIDR